MPYQAHQATVGISQNEFIRRVFARTGAAYLGIDMPSVPVGHAMYPVLTSAISPKTYAKGTENESLAATFTPKVLKPSTFTSKLPIPH